MNIFQRIGRGIAAIGRGVGNLVEKITGRGKKQTPPQTPPDTGNIRSLHALVQQINMWADTFSPANGNPAEMQRDSMTVDRDARRIVAAIDAVFDGTNKSAGAILDAIAEVIPKKAIETWLKEVIWAVYENDEGKTYYRAGTERLPKQIQLMNDIINAIQGADS